MDMATPGGREHGPAGSCHPTADPATTIPGDGRQRFARVTLRPTDWTRESTTLPARSTEKHEHVRHQTPANLLRGRAARQLRRGRRRPVAHALRRLTADRRA